MSRVCSGFVEPAYGIEGMWLGYCVMLRGEVDVGVCLVFGGAFMHDRTLA